MIETYALLDNGSEVTLRHERLVKVLGLDGQRFEFTGPILLWLMGTGYYVSPAGGERILG